MPPLRLAELLASLSLATDLGTGQPLGHGIRTCLLALALAREMGCEADDIRSTYQATLLRFLGCTADAAETAAMAGGDDLSFNAAMAPVFLGGSRDLLKATVTAVGHGQPPGRRVRMVVDTLTDAGGMSRALAAHCEVASMLAVRLDVEDRVILALQHAYERWDGKGYPAGLAGEAIPIEIRIATVARDADVLSRQGENEMAILRHRQGKAYDPEVVEALARLGTWRPEADWEELMESEPEPVEYVGNLDRALTAMADFVDLKSPWTRGHSRRVAKLAGDAALVAGFGQRVASHLSQAALVHDLGRVGVENGIWDKPATLSTDEWEKVRMHPYLTDRILSRCPAMAGLGEIASSHHERMDGSGYHRHSTADHLSRETRILAAADVFVALGSDRPYRGAFSQGDALAIIRDEVADGRLDREAVSCVVTAAGGAVGDLRSVNPEGLTEREVEVLRLMAGGLTNRQMGDRLFISPKTVGRHVENIYLKIGVSTRAGAAVYAMERRLLD